MVPLIPLAISCTRLVAVEKNATASLKYHNVQVYLRTFVRKYDVVFAYNIQLLLIVRRILYLQNLRTGVQQQKQSIGCSVLGWYWGNAIRGSANLHFSLLKVLFFPCNSQRYTHTYCIFGASEIPCLIHVAFSRAFTYITMCFKNETCLRSKYVSKEQRMVSFLPFCIFNIQFIQIFGFDC